MPGGGVGTPIQVQGMDPAQAAQGTAVAPGTAVAYQTIPVIGPNGLQYTTIPVQSLPTGCFSTFNL